MHEKSKKRILINNPFISKCLSDTEKFAIEIAKNANKNDIFCLEGELGVGKTVVAKAIGKFFHVKDSITSPTFNIIKTYNTSDNLIKKIHHFDLYRIKNIDELTDIGFEEYIYEDNSIALIEWPEIAYGILPIKKKIIKICKNTSFEQKTHENERILKYEECK